MSLGFDLLFEYPAELKDKTVLSLPADQAPYKKRSVIDIFSDDTMAWCYRFF